MMAKESSDAGTRTRTLFKSQNLLAPCSSPCVPKISSPGIESSLAAGTEDSRTTNRNDAGLQPLLLYYKRLTLALEVAKLHFVDTAAWGKDSRTRQQKGQHVALSGQLHIRGAQNEKSLAKVK